MFYFPVKDNLSLSEDPLIIEYTSTDLMEENLRDNASPDSNVF